jgi:hypothetical protein
MIPSVSWAAGGVSVWGRGAGAEWGGADGGGTQRCRRQEPSTAEGTPQGHHYAHESTRLSAHHIMSALGSPEWLSRLSEEKTKPPPRKQQDAPPMAAAPGRALAAGPKGRRGRGGGRDGGRKELSAQDFTLTGAHEEAIDGEYWVSAAQPSAHGRPHYAGTGGYHVYYLEQPGRWVINDQFVPHKARCVASITTDGQLPLGQLRWDYFAGSASGLSGVTRPLTVVEGRVEPSPETPPNSPPASPTPTPSPPVIRSRSSAARRLQECQVEEGSEALLAQGRALCRITGDTSPGADEVAAMADYIRVDPHERQRTMAMLAEQALCAPLPSGWRGFYNPNFTCMFYFDQTTGTTTWHHPLERSFSVAAGRLKFISGEMRRLKATGDAGDDEGAQEAMRARYDAVLRAHVRWLRKLVGEETPDEREIRRLRFGPPFRQHCDRMLVRQRSLMRTVTDAMRSHSKPSDEASDPPGERRKGTASKWKLAKRKVVAQNTAQKVTRTLSALAERAQEKDAAADEESGRGELDRSDSRPHDFNSVQLASWRLWNTGRSSAVREAGIVAEAEELLGPAAPGGMTQGGLLQVLIHLKNGHLGGPH